MEFQISLNISVEVTICKTHVFVLKTLETCVEVSGAGETIKKRQSEGP